MWVMPFPLWSSQSLSNFLIASIFEIYYFLSLSAVGSDMIIIITINIVITITLLK